MRLRSEVYAAGSSLLGAVHLLAEGRLLVKFLTTFDEVLCENLHKLRRQSTLRKEKTEQKSNNQKKQTIFFDENKTKNKEFVSLLI